LYSKANIDISQSEWCTEDGTGRHAKERIVLKHLRRDDFIANLLQNVTDIEIIWKIIQCLMKL